MTYTAIGVLAVVIAVLLDLFVFKTRMVTRAVFWSSYAIIVFFQLITNGLFTGTQIVKYYGAAIMGGSSPADSAPTFLGDGRIAFAPAEDLLFGFSLILLSISLWVFWGRRGVDRTPTSGPPIWRK